MAIEGDQQHDKQNPEASSSESAGIARGIARSVLQVQKRTAIGKVPQRVIPKKLPRFSAKRVATISDKMSNVMDVSTEVIDIVSQVDTDKSASENSKQAFKSPASNSSSSLMFSLRSKANYILSFSGNILKNSLLGAAVFETYDYVIENSVTSSMKKSHSNQATNNYQQDIYSHVPLWLHFGAGAAAGSIHSILQKTIDVAICDRSFSSFRSLALNITNHATAHSILFGGYELSKRSLTSLSSSLFSSNDSSQPRNMNNTYFSILSADNDEVKSTSVAQITIVAFSGGIAGSLQQLATHYSRHLEENIFMKSKVSIIRSLVRLSPPSIRSICTAAPGNALAFVAFEYGKEFVESKTV